MLAPLANTSHAVVLSPTPESAAHFLGAPKPYPDIY